MNPKGHVRTIFKKFTSEGHFKELIIKSSFAFIIRIGAAISSFLMNVIIARRLGAYEAGNFFLCLAIISVFSTIIRFGGDNILVRYVGIYQSEGNLSQVKSLLNSLLLRVTIFAFIVTAILLLFNSDIASQVFGKADLKPVLFWMQIAMPFFGVYTLVSYAFQGLNHVILSVTIQSIVVPLGVSVFIWFYNPVNAVEVAQIYLVFTLVTILLTFLLWHRIVPVKSQKMTLSYDIKRSINTLWLFSIIQMILQWGGQFVAGIYTDQAQLAQLSVCQRTTMLISFILIAVNLVSAPRFAKLYHENKIEELKKYAVNATRLMIVFSTPIVIIIWIFPFEIMNLFGEGFENGIWMLRVLALGQFVNVITGSVGYLLLMSGNEKDMRNITIIVGLFSLVLSILLTKYYGALGTSVAIALALAAQNLMAVRMVKKRLGFNTMAIF